MLGVSLILSFLLFTQTASSATTCSLSTSAASQLKLDSSDVKSLLLLAGYAHYSCTAQGAPQYNGTVGDIFDVTCSADDVIGDLSKARNAKLSAAAAEVVARRRIGNIAPGGSQFSLDGGVSQIDIVELSNPSENVTAINPSFSNGPSSNDLTSYVADASSNPSGIHSMIRTNSFGGGPVSSQCSPNTISKSRVVTLLALVQTNADGKSTTGLSSDLSSSDSRTLSELLKFSHVIAGIVVIAAILAFLGMAVGVYSCTRRGGATILESRVIPTAYQPVQLSAPKPYSTPYDGYRDEPMRYDP